VQPEIRTSVAKPKNPLAKVNTHKLKADESELDDMEDESFSSDGFEDGDSFKPELVNQTAEPVQTAANPSKSDLNQGEKLVAVEPKVDKDEVMVDEEDDDMDEG